MSPEFTFPLPSTSEQRSQLLGRKWEFQKPLIILFLRDVLLKNTGGKRDNNNNNKTQFGFSLNLTAT